MTTVASTTNLQKQNEKSSSIMSCTKQAQHTKDWTMKTMVTSTKMMIRELYSKEQEQLDLILRIRMLKKVRRQRSNAERKNQNDHHAFLLRGLGGKSTVDIFLTPSTPLYRPSAHVCAWDVRSSFVVDCLRSCDMMDGS